MEYVYATLLVNEADRELNEENLTAVLSAAGCEVSESRVRALVAALEGLDLGGLGAASPTDGAEPGDEGPDEPADGPGREG